MLATSSAGSPATRFTRVAGSVEIGPLGAVTRVVVYLVPANSQSAAIPDELLRRPYRIDQRGLRFDPHVLAVPVGATVEFANSDNVLHNIFVPPLGTHGFDLGTWPRGETRSHTFDEPGVNVILCNVHPDMEAFVVVVPTPWFTQTTADGSFSIDGVPPGAYTLRAWHERARPYERAIDVNGQDLALDIFLEMVRAPE